jgi:replicative DNA helicase
MNQPSQEKLWNLAAEAGVLGSIVLDDAAVVDVLAILPDENFFFKAEHQMIFAVLRELHGAGKATDGVMLRDELERAGQLERVGGVAYIREIVESVPSSANAKFYARIVKERWHYRRLMQAVQDMQKMLDEPLDVAEQTEQIRQLALSLPMNHEQNGCYTFRDCAEKVAASLGQNDTSLPTGFANIDNLIGGFRPGELIISAGRPAMGKSALALGIAENMAKNGVSVIYVSLEMGHRSLIERAIGMAGDLNVRAIRNFPQIDNIYQQAIEAAHIISKYDFVVHENLNTPEKLTAFVTEEKKSKKIDIVFVDYLQLMSTKGKAENRVAEISSVSRQLKTLAMVEGIIIVGLSQLNRECESRTGHRPRLSDLRESGAIEQDADIVILLHREDYYRLMESPKSTDIDGTAEIIVAKNRRGPTGVANLVFLPEFVKFGDLAREDT